MRRIPAPGPATAAGIGRGSDAPAVNIANMYLLAITRNVFKAAGNRTKFDDTFVAAAFCMLIAAQLVSKLSRKRTRIRLLAVGVVALSRITSPVPPPEMVVHPALFNCVCRLVTILLVPPGYWIAIEIYSNVNVPPLAWIAGAVLPFKTLRLVPKGPYARRLPPLDASYHPAPITVPQSAVGVANVIAVPLRLICDAAAGKLVALLVTPTRA